jgi:TRAP-type mannitol/chloroaromatic compound transport system substrate-binding protein
MASSYPKSLDTLFGAGAQVAKRAAEATDNKFQIQVFAAGEIVGGLQVLDAVQNGTVESGYTLSSYYIGGPHLRVRYVGAVGHERPTAQCVMDFGGAAS